MADKKKLSVDEILAMARGKKVERGSAPVKSTPAEKTAAAPQAEEAAADASSGEEAAPAAPVAKVDAKKMSTAEIMAMARGGGAKPAAAAPAKPAAKPASAAPAKGGAMSVADILAAARGGSAPAAEKPEPKPAAAKAAAPAKVEKAPAAVLEKTVVRDNASILGDGAGKKLGPVSKSEANQSGVAVAAKPAKEKIAVPPMPSRPVLAGATATATTAPTTDRRGVLAASVAALAATFGYLLGNPLAIGFTSLATTGLVWTLGGARYMFPNVLVEPPTKFKAGFPDTLSPGQVETKYIPQFGVWVVKNEYEGKQIIYAIKSVCTHLGCTPNWLEGEQKFKCPCHGSGFYKDGINFEGPAPRPLERYAISLADDGQLMVDKSRVFNQELGQWSDPNSFVPV